ncbi:MAG: hypothetical protein WAK50_07415 [Nitrososphaeraceae archaeon]
MSSENELGRNQINTNQKDEPPVLEEVSTYRKLSMDYYTRDGVILRTGLSNLIDWFLLCVRELLDNAIDFLLRYHQGYDNCVISVEIFKDDNFFYLKVKNPNSNNLCVFKNKVAIFDDEHRYGSKQDLHIISRGMLGDAMKQILAFGYILIHLEDDGSSFEDKQWERPLIIRHNKAEYNIYLKIDKARQTRFVDIHKSPNELEDPTTEIELTLPIPNDVKNELSRTCIEEFCKKYPIFTTDITFKFEITDNSSPVESIEAEQTKIADYPNYEISDSKIAETILTTIADESPGATVNIEYNALHSISTQSWNKQNSVHSYTPEEFKRRILNTDHTQAIHITIYDLLKTYREGSNLGKTAEHELSVAELVALPEQIRNKKIESFYKQLKDALPRPEKLLLSYTTNKEGQKNALVARCNRLYSNLDKDKNKASYRTIHSRYEDVNISYPYFFEILAIPFDDPRSADNNVVFIGAVNYSVSPKENSNLFEGDYNRYLPVDLYTAPKNILGVLEINGFHDYANDTAKIPCLIIANLVTPRREPHGQDKSRIDIAPFAGTIVDAVRKLAVDIKSYRAVGIRFSKPTERRTAIQVSSGRGLLEGVLTDYLQKNHGL